MKRSEMFCKVKWLFAGAVYTSCWWIQLTHCKAYSPKTCWEPPTFLSHTSRSSTHQEGLMSESLRLINFYYSDFVLHSSLVWHVAATCRRGVNLWPNCHLSWNSVNALPWFCRPRSGNHLPVPCISTPPWFLHPSPPPPFSRYYPTAPACALKSESAHRAEWMLESWKKRRWTRGRQENALCSDKRMQ